MVVGVLTNPDRTAGRGRELSFSPVKDAALELGLPVMQPEKLDAVFRETVRKLEPELLVAFAYGRIFGPRFLECFPRGGVNLHPSLLPRYRGPSPINAAILNGDTQAGITVQSLALEMDAGDIIMQESFPLTGKETAESLGETAAHRGALLLVQALDRIAAGKESRRPQDPAGVTYCGLLDRDQGKIDWKNSAVHIERMVRAFDPWPGVWTAFHGSALRILAAAALPDEASDAGCPHARADGAPASGAPRAHRMPEGLRARDSGGAIAPATINFLSESDRLRARDCSGKPTGFPVGKAEDLERKARFFAEQKRRPENSDEAEITPGKVLGVDTRRGILVQTGEGLLAVGRLQLASKKAMDFAAFLNGAREFVGSVLGDTK
jgi:methionyl-tRNA formyltransferase